MGPTVEDRVLEVGDEWLPQNVTLDNVDEFAKRAAALQSRAADAGRGRIPMTLVAGSPKPQAVESCEQAGITRVLFLLPSAGADEVLPRLDRLAKTHLGG